MDVGPHRCNTNNNSIDNDSREPNDGYDYSGDFLNENKIIGVTPLIAK
jgi:hypothetical protein